MPRGVTVRSGRGRSAEATTPSAPVLRRAWSAASAAAGWRTPSDWAHPAVDAVCEVLADGGDVWACAQRLGAARAAAGVGLGEALADIDAVIEVVGGAHADEASARPSRQVRGDHGHDGERPEPLEIAARGGCGCGHGGVLSGRRATAGASLMEPLPYAAHRWPLFRARDVRLARRGPNEGRPEKRKGPGWKPGPKVRATLDDAVLSLPGLDSNQEPVG